MSKMDPVESKETVLEKIKKGVYQKITVTEKKSHIWEYFREVRDNNNVFQKFLICKNCDALFMFKYGRTGTSSLGRHILVCHKRYVDLHEFDKKKVFSPNIKKEKQVKVKEPTESETLKLITKTLINECLSLCVKDIRPFEIFEGEGMIQFAQALLDIGAKYRKVCSKDILPQASVIAQHAKELANYALPNVVENIKTLLRNGQHVAISTDSWSDSHRRIFLSIVCHYINEDWELKKVALGCTELMYKKSYINNELLDFLLTLGFETTDIESKFTFVSNRNSGDVESKWLNKQPCIVHIINTVILHTFCDAIDEPIYYELHDEEFSNSLQELFNNAINLITYIKTLNDKLLINTDIKSSWNTKYALLMNLSKEEAKINECLHSINEEERLQNIDFPNINIISEFLEPFKIIIDALQDEGNCTIYGVLLFKMKLDNHLLLKFNDPPILKKLKKRAEIVLKDKFTILLHHKIATFLCPKFKSLQFMSEPEKIETYEIVQQRVSELVIMRDKNGMNSSVKTDMSLTSENNASLLDFEEFSDNALPNDTDCGTEFYTYLQSSMQCETSQNHIGGVDLLNFWKSKEKTFPIMAKLAKSILCVPAYGMISEKIFDKTNCKQDERKNNMNPENLSTILILNTAEDMNLKF